MDSYEARRNHCWTYNNTVRSAGGSHALLFAMDLSCCTEQATLVMEGGSAKYEVTHKTGSGVWHLVDGKGDVLATATKPSAWKSTVEVEPSGGGSKLFLSTVRRGRYNSVITNAASETLASLFKESVWKYQVRAEVAKGTELPPLMFAFMYAIFVLQYRRRDAQYGALIQLAFHLCITLPYYLIVYR